MSGTKYKHTYRRASGKRFPYNIEVNLKGFLCSCYNREKDCVRDAYNILNKYADILYPQQEVKAETGDIADELANELKELKETKHESRRFQVVESGAKNILFIKTTLDDPVALAHKIAEDIHVTKVQQTKFLVRLVPIETICKAFIKEIEKAVQPLIEKYFKNGSRTFSIVFNHRNNSSLSRDDVIKSIGDLITTTGIEHKVDIKNAEVSIVVEVIRSFALIGVVPDYTKYKKYNLLSMFHKDEIDDP